MNLQGRKLAMTRIRACVRTAAVCVGGVGWLLTASLAGAQGAERVSVRNDGGQGNGPSSGAATNADGRCVAFYSDAANLLPQGPDGDRNAVRDVFVFDRLAEPRLQRVSVATDGSEANGPSQAQGFRPAVAGDCSCVAYSSDATNLVPGDANARTDVFVRDIAAAATERVSVASDGSDANSSSSFPSVSGDCNKVVFQSTASNLVDADVNGVADIFVYDRGTGTTTRVSVGPDGTPGDGMSITPVISADGRCVAFASTANTFCRCDSNDKIDIYVACDGAVTCRASVSSDGEEANGDSFLPAISADGRYVAFKSLASNLVPGDLNHAADVFVHDCTTGETELASVTARGGAGNDHSFPPAISGDGRFVAFGSFATNMTQGLDTGGQSQIYVRDRLLGTTMVASLNPAGTPANGGAPDIPVSISLDGRFVAFASLASDLASGDSNEVMDAFLAANATATPTLTPTDTPIKMCATTEDCPEGTLCVDGFCLVPTPTPVVTDTPTPTPETSCFVDLDCQVGQVCIDGVCREVRCSDANPCPEGRVCNEKGVCEAKPLTPTPLPICTTDADCTPPDRCRAMVCVPPRVCDDTNPAVDRHDCRGPRETCLGGSCECGGDCNLDGQVFGNEISVAINILGDPDTTPLSTCPAADIIDPLDGVVMGNEITLAVQNLGLGCPGEGLPLELLRDRSGETRTLVITGGAAVRGGEATIGVEMNGGGEVATAQIDLLYDTSVLRIDDPATACRVDDRLAATHTVAAFRPRRPAAPEGKARLRLFVGDVVFPVAAFTEGRLVSCVFKVVENAPLGPVDVAGDRLNVGDPGGNVFASTSQDGTVDVSDCSTDTQCPEGEQCVKGRCLSGECLVGDDCPFSPRQACVDGICVCAGDCNGDGNVLGNEVTIAVNILGGTTLADQCLAADVDGNGQVFGNEITLAVTNLGNGCPR